jgi:hypothetical protein
MKFGRALIRNWTAVKSFDTDASAGAFRLGYRRKTVGFGTSSGCRKEKTRCVNSTVVN